MDMSAAALPPQYIAINENDRKHPRFNEYMRWRSSMSRLMVQGNTFENWLYQTEFQEKCDKWAKHPEYQSFMKWMRENQGGARKCPAFPENFKNWLNGTRW